MKVKWGPDVPVELKLEEFGVKWRDGIVRMDRIDWAASRMNHARIDTAALSMELAEEYSQAMLRGDVFPKVVVLELPRDKYFILGGNHRAEGARLAGDEELKAYIATTTDEAIIDLLPRVLNRMHGRRMDRNEALNQARYAIATHALKTKQAALMFGVSESTLLMEQRITRAGKFLTDNNINPAGWPKTKLEALERLENDNVKKAVAIRLIAPFPKANGQEVDAMIGRVIANKNELKQLDEVDRIEAEWKKIYGQDPGPAKRIVRPVRTLFLSDLRRLENHLEKRKTFKQLQITEPAEAVEVAKRLAKLAKLFKALGGG